MNFFNLVCINKFEFNYNNSILQICITLLYYDSSKFQVFFIIFVNYTEIPKQIITKISLNTGEQGLTPQITK